MPHTTTGPDSPTDLGASLREKEALYRVTSAIIEHTELGDLLQTVVDSVAEALPAERVVLITFDIQAEAVRHFVKGGTGAGSVVRVSYDELQHGLSGWVLREQAPALSPKNAPDPRELPDVQQRRLETQCGDIIVVPLLYRGQMLGTLTAINHFEGVPFGQQQVDTMATMASHAAAALTTAEYQAQLVHEIEERKKLEQNLAQARDAALDASRMKTEFLANMSHEIRTPMNAILGLLRVLQGTELSRQQQDYVHKTQGAAQTLLGLVNDVLDFSRIEAGKITIESAPVHLDQVLRNLSVLLSASTAANDVEVLFDIDPELPSVVLGDALRLEQILSNLGGNAVKFTPHGHVLITLRQVTRLPEEVRIAFSVRDTGIGISPEQQSRIFDAFSQAESSTTRRYGGTGLGLAICKRFIAMMGGELQVDSALGQGSCFSFTLTLLVPAHFPQPLAKIARSGTAPQRVLVVDDNAMASDVTRRMAESWGWMAHTALSGTAAIEMTAKALRRNPSEFPYSLVVMDWRMAPPDGWETTRQLRALAAKHRLTQPIIIMVTAQSREVLALRTEAERASINGYLVKPITASMLLDAFMDSKSDSIGQPQPAQKPADIRRLEGLRILVVEDNFINQQVAKELLSHEGAKITIAANGQLGVDAVASANPPFDAVLMDLQMPVLDGYGATRAIREDLQRRDLPIIAVTANAMASDRAACLAAGMDEHVGKPFNIDRLVELIVELAAKDAAHNAPALQAVGHAEVPLPKIPGMDLQAALARMGGKRDLYGRNLRDFANALKSVWDETQALLAAGDHVALTMHLHTLKGNAATLGASALSKTVAHLERLYRSPRNATERALGMEEFARAVTKAQELLALALLEFPEQDSALASVSAQALDTGRAIEALRTIDALAQSFNMDVVQRFTELSSVLAGIPGGFAAEMETALQKLALPEVHQMCTAKLRELTAG